MNCVMKDTLFPDPDSASDFKLDQFLAAPCETFDPHYGKVPGWSSPLCHSSIWYATMNPLIYDMIMYSFAEILLVCCSSSTSLKHSHFIEIHVNYTCTWRRNFYILHYMLYMHVHIHVCVYRCRWI